LKNLAFDSISVDDFILFKHSLKISQKKPAICKTAFNIIFGDSLPTLSGGEQQLKIILTCLAGNLLGWFS
jgi:hypothetical protein